MISLEKGYGVATMQNARLAARAEHLTPEVLEKLNKPTMRVDEVGRLLFDVGRAASYSAARKGDMPTIKIGRKLFVPTWKLREMLGLTEPQQAA